MAMINRILGILDRRSVQQDLLLLILALALATSPFWAPATLWASDDYRYGSTEVVATETGLEFIDDGADVPDGVSISEEIACSGTLVDRTCGTERAVVEQGPMPIGIESDRVERDDRIASPTYRFVQLDGTVYRATYDVEDGTTGPVVANLSPALPDAALHGVSIDANDEDVPGTAVEAAEDGEATAGSTIGVPSTPIQLDDGSYHRVYLLEAGGDGASSPLVFAVFFGLALGITILVSLSRKIRINVRYVRNQ